MNMKYSSISNFWGIANISELFLKLSIDIQLLAIGKAYYDKW